MWRYGIHNLLELLRHQLPYHMDFMMQFIIHAYQMVALLVETVPLFEETWTECLGDLSRYRMAVEETDMQAREVWAATARFWYCKSAEKTAEETGTELAGLGETTLWPPTAPCGAGRGSELRLDVGMERFGDDVDTASPSRPRGVLRRGKLK